VAEKRIRGDEDGTIWSREKEEDEAWIYDNSPNWKLIQRLQAEVQKVILSKSFK
jgi:hypothetical protein